MFIVADVSSCSASFGTAQECQRPSLAQLGHDDPTFTLRIYTHAVKRRQRLATAELAEYEKALDWARMRTNLVLLPSAVAAPSNEAQAEAAI